MSKTTKIIISLAVIALLALAGWLYVAGKESEEAEGGGAWLVNEG